MRLDSSFTTLSVKTKCLGQVLLFSDYLGGLMTGVNVVDQWQTTHTKTTNSFSTAWEHNGNVCIFFFSQDIII